MFGFLKDKLKKTLSVFSKKAKEEVTEEKVAEKPIEAVKEEVKVLEKPVAEKKPETKREKILEELKETIVEAKPEVKVEKPKEEARKDFIKQQIKKTALEEEPLAKVDFEKIKIKPEPEVKEVVEEPKEEKRGFFAKAKEYLSTKKISSEKFDELFWDLELALLENNVSVEVIEKIKKDLKAELVDKPLPWHVDKKIEETLKASLQNILYTEKIDLLKKIHGKKPFIIAFFGINGSGKTTTIAKIAHLLKKNHLISVLAAADTFRAAAIQQLEEHAQKLKLKIIKHDYGADAAAVAFDAVKFAQRQNLDVVLIDTAGRLHSDVNLMDELKKIVRVVKPDLKIFVGESITGNDCVEQARQFHQQIGLDALILTKADVDEKGGAALSVSFITKKPILFIGTGQDYDSLKEFNAELVLNSLGLK